MCIDDEHRLIARYAARLAADTKDAVSTIIMLTFICLTKFGSRDSNSTFNQDFIRHL